MPSFIRTLKALAFVLSVLGSAVAQSATASKISIPPEKAVPIRVARFDQPPVIDGKLDDEAWTHATVFKDFIQTRPGDNIAPSRETVMLIGYDSKFLYF